MQFNNLQWLSLKVSGGGEGDDQLVAHDEDSGGGGVGEIFVADFAGDGYIEHHFGVFISVESRFLVIAIIWFC